MPRRCCSYRKHQAKRDAGVIDDMQARKLIMDAAKNCARKANNKTMAQKIAEHSADFREPYDCGMAYYFLSYYTSGLTDKEFFERFFLAMAVRAYDGASSLCLRYESNCQNAKLTGATGDQQNLLQEMGWLEKEIATMALPLLRPTKSALPDVTSR